MVYKVVIGLLNGPLEIWCMVIGFDVRYVVEKAIWNRWKAILAYNGMTESVIRLVFLLALLSREDKNFIIPL